MSRLPRKTRIVILVGACALLVGLNLVPSRNDPSWSFVGGWGVLGMCVFGAVWFVKRKNNGLGSTTHMQLIEHLVLDQGRTLHLVDVDGHRILLASHQSGIGLISIYGQETDEASVLSQEKGNSLS